MAIQVQEFNGDILVDGDVSSSSVTSSAAAISGTVSAGSTTINGTLTANTASIKGAVTAAFLSATGSSTNQTMSQAAITNAINSSVSNTVNRVYPVGAVYISTSSTSPASLFGGSWQQLTADAYFKIVTSGAGAVGGTSSNHIIPLASMPQHTGHVPEAALPGTGSLALGAAACIKQENRQFTPFTNEALIITQYAGNSRPYYPYYYGVFAWRRIS